MKFNKDSVVGTMIFTVVLSLLCSFMITGTSELLKERKLAKKRDELKRYVLTAANVEMKSANDFRDIFERSVKPLLIDLDSGSVASDKGVLDFDERMAAINPDTSIKPKKDRAKIRRRANQVRVFKVFDDHQQLDCVVVPVHGKGMWSMIYGYVALESDLNTVRGVLFYEHGETPGISDFVQAPEWAEKWNGKQIFNDKQKVSFRIVKGGADADDVNGIDGVSGATNTARGIQRSVQFWFGDEGYQKFFNSLKASES